MMDAETQQTTNLPDAEQLLQARARRLAQPLTAVPRAGTQLELLEFKLAEERYALETRYVEEVHPLLQLTPLPCAPSFVLGIVNVRGRILPVLDLKKFFELPEKGLTDLHCIILVRGAGLEFGLLADIVVGVHSMTEHRLQPSLPTLTGIRAQYLKGVTDEALVVLDFASILADPKIIVRDEHEN